VLKTGNQRKVSLQQNKTKKSAKVSSYNLSMNRLVLLQSFGVAAFVMQENVIN
jgi:hypothetical protein